MPKILFARLKVKEQEQIVAGTIKIAGSAGTAAASATLPNPDLHCVTTILSVCEKPEEPEEPPVYSTSSPITGHSINPINK